ncbi:MAG: hypothetical protein ISS26_05550 [Candidatus Omnitrophica bacterium]|nr:hypothetical protein [Candidatus Omnitrophota bacterium]
MASIIGGGIAMVLGILGLTLWWDPFLAILKGSVPVLLLLGGLISLIAGMSEIKEASKKIKKKKSKVLGR